MKICVNCREEIPPERLEILPETKTCIKCSQEESLIGITIWDKTTPIFVAVNSQAAEMAGRLERLDGRLNRL